MSSKVKKRSWWARYNWWLGLMWVRAIVLIVAALLAYLCSGIIVGCLESKFPVIEANSYIGEVNRWVMEKNASNEYIRKVLTPATYSLPIFLALWWFRTYDSRMQIQRANFEAGVAHIASDTPINIEIGVQILLGVSEVTSAFDREICITFIKRLKRPVSDNHQQYDAIKNYRYGYAQHMFRWMTARDGEWDLSNMQLQNQEFTLEGVALESILRLSDADDPTPKTFPINFDECHFANKDHFFKGYDDYHEEPNPKPKSADTFETPPGVAALAGMVENLEKSMKTVRERKPKPRE